MKGLFDTSQIGNMKLKNRLWRSASWLNMADKRGYPTEELISAYTELANGGVGTIITGYAYVMENEQPNPHMLGIYSDEFIPVYRNFTNSIHKSNTNIVLQICYGGSATDYNTENREILGPSAVPHPAYGIEPKEMTLENIKTVVDAHVQAARRAKASGFDGVQIHAAHSYLYSQFLSPYFNKRDDDYGGSSENRARIIFDTLKAIREEVGEDYPVFIKMHASDEWGNYGLNTEESLTLSLELEKLGISGIEFSGGNLDASSDKNLGPIRGGILKVENQSYFAEKTAYIAEHLTTPVISVGGHRNPEVMTNLLNTTNIGYFSMSRTLLSEPTLPNKWQSDIKASPRCVGCCKCWSESGNRCVLDRI